MITKHQPLYVVIVVLLLILPLTRQARPSFLFPLRAPPRGGSNSVSNLVDDQNATSTNVNAIAAIDAADTFEDSFEGDPTTWHDPRHGTPHRLDYVAVPTPWRGRNTRANGTFGYEPSQPSRHWET